MAVTPQDIATALGQATPSSDSPTYGQWSMWIEEAQNLIQWRATDQGVTDLDPDKVDLVVRKAVVAMARRKGDDSTQVTTSVDDGSVSRTYKSSSGEVEILDRWWALLGLTSPANGAFSVDTAGTTTTIHGEACSLTFGAVYCSCAADIAGFPLYGS